MSPARPLAVSPEDKKTSPVPPTVADPDATLTYPESPLVVEFPDKTSIAPEFPNVATLPVFI